ncbi:dna polymerase delta subunit 3 [Trichoderma arundinaceum]|uniref:DNA polymerase delta subunit 3 n=1 Tax=Trichoderma arundinaceum TaxID=490622 RepID=A0A395NCZ6_TRIAR|nr:dna polymerase delta subunit 3 [Trichoderma arundinaceum]
MDDPKKYLSDRLLSEEVPNASKANSIHATYLVYGSKTEDREPEAGDTEMDSSVPEPEPLSDYAPTRTFTIVAEENLNDVLAEYEEITSFHIYSLAPFPQKDLALLSDVSKSLSEYRKIEDAAKSLDTYGIIANPQARKKDRKGRPPVAAPAPAPAPSAPRAVKQETQSAVAKPNQPEKVKQEAKEAPSSDTTPSSSAGKKPPATLKRGASGGIMQSFAKAAAKPPRPKAKPEPKVEDTSMALSDDGEADEEDLPAAKAVDLEALKRTRKEREEQLMRMMEDPEDEVKEETKKEDEQSDEEMEEASEPEPEPEPEPESEQPKEEKEPAEVVSNSSDGRRRGKRRIMKKKRILDDQGYMVTIQEAAWESFSEDEAPPPPPTAKPTPASTPAASSTQKSKKAAATGKSGSQGSIMSFFAKK